MAIIWHIVNFISWGRISIHFFHLNFTQTSSSSFPQTNRKCELGLSCFFFLSKQEKLKALGVQNLYRSSQPRRPSGIFSVFLSNLLSLIFYNSYVAHHFFFPASGQTGTLFCSNCRCRFRKKNKHPLLGWNGPVLMINKLLLW